MQQTLTNLSQRIQSLPLLIKLLLQGLILTILLVGLWVWFEGQLSGYMSYMPPIGLVIYGVLLFLVEPIALGAVNIALVNVLFGTRGWQVNFWLNGIFLFLIFTTINVVLQTALDVSFTVAAVIDIVLLAIPMGALGRFSNGGWKKPMN